MKLFFYSDLYRLCLKFEFELFHLPPEDGTPSEAGSQPNPEFLNRIGINLQTKKVLK